MCVELRDMSKPSVSAVLERRAASGDVELVEVPVLEEPADGTYELGND